MEDLNLSFDDMEFYKGTSFYVAGTWNKATEYHNNSSRIDVVSHNGNSYMALKDNINIEPGTDATAWQIMAKAGDAGTIEIGTVETVSSGQNASVTNVGTSHKAKLNFKIPKGADGVTEITNLDELENYIYYGVKRKVEQNSSSAWERIGASIGKTANATKNGDAVTNDFDSIYPWSDIITCNLDPSTNEIKAFIGDPTFDFTGQNGEVMTRIPEFYWKRYVKDGYEYILISRHNLADFNLSKEFFVGRYDASFDGTRLHSVTGEVPEVQRNISAFRSLAKAVGDKWSQMDYHYFLLQMLYLVEYADYNSQSKLGNGISSCRVSDADKALVAESNTNRIIINSSAASNFIVGQQASIGTSSAWNWNVAKNRTILSKSDYNSGGVTGTAVTFDGDPVNIALNNVLWTTGQKSGQCDSLGMKSGCLNNDGKHAIIYRGIENIFGNIWQFVDGINLKDYQAYICYDPSEYVSDKFTDPYKELGYMCFKPAEGSSTTNREGYAKELGYDPLNPMVSLTTEVGGASNTYMTDYAYINSGNRIALVGGYFNYGVKDGLWYWYLSNYSSNTDINIGARLLKYQD